MSRTDAIHLDRVDAHRRKRLALDNVSFDIPRGTITSVVGPNGAGKSTLLGLISGRLRPTSGTLRVHSTPAEVLQFTSVDPDLPLTVRDVVRQGRYRDRGLLRPLGRHDRMIVDQAIEAVDMSDHKRTPMAHLSGGQRQRVLVAQGLAQQSPILLLDEPTAGVDAPTQRRLREVIKDVASEGRTVMYSTHSLEEAALSDYTVALACRCICCAPTTHALVNDAVVDLFSMNQRDQRSRLADSSQIELE